MVDLVGESKDEVVKKLYDGREELLSEGSKRLGPMTIIKIQKILRSDTKAFHYYASQLSLGRTADMITIDELEKAGVKGRTIVALSKLFN